MNMLTLALAKKHTNSLLSDEKKEIVLVTASLVDGFTTVEQAIGLTVGSTYTVITDSATYTAVCKQDETTKSKYLGNTLYIAGVDNGEKFAIVESFDDVTSSYVTVLADVNGGANISVTETIHPIDPKFLPVTTPLVLTLGEDIVFNDDAGNYDKTIAALTGSGSVEKTSGVPHVSEETLAKITNAINSNRSIVVRFDITGDMPISIPVTCTFIVDGTYCLSGISTFPVPAWFAYAVVYTSSSAAYPNGAGKTLIAKPLTVATT